ncbi:hypothetical protein JCM18899A_41240 [Nocardioides sp. AN3]
MAKASGATCAPSGALYGLGILGAWVWFWQQSDGFWGHVWALVEGVLWPAYLVYQAFAALS